MNPFSAGALSLRRRSVWEAADSGILLWRNSFIHFIPFFVLPILIVACGLRFLSGNASFLSYFVIWWLKPLFDRMVLHVISIRFFTAEGNTPSSGFREQCKGLLEMRRGLLGDLLWRRFSPGRAAHMPIRVLERASGEKFHLRKKNLAAGGLGFCFVISLFCLVMEALFLFSGMIFVTIISQMFFPEALAFMLINLELVEIFIFAAFCIMYILVGSLYVCMGFSLYINSRVEVEGWDLQLLFQKFAAGKTAGLAVGKTAASRPGVTTFLLLCLFLTLPHMAYSDSEPAAETHFSFMEGLPSPGAEPLEILEHILASPDFGEIREGWGIRFRERAQAESADRDTAPWMERIRQTFGHILRVIAILASVGFAGFVLYSYWKNRWKRSSGAQDKGRSYTNPLFSPESPHSLFASAEDFFQRGNLREAWAACLAGCIGACAKHRLISFPADATEYGCLDLVRHAMPAQAEGFRNLVRNWVLFAYGGRAPGEGAFEQALAYGRSLLEIPAADRTEIG